MALAQATMVFAFGSGLCDGFFTEDGANFLRLCNLIAQAGVKAAPCADDGDVEVFVVEHQVEICITFSDVKFAAVSLNRFGQDIADGDDFCAVRLCSRPTMSTRDTASTNNSNAIRHVNS